MDYHSAFTKEGDPAIRNDMDEPWGHYAMRNKLDTETETAWFHWYVEPKKVEYRGIERGMVGPAVGVLGEKEILVQGYKVAVTWDE